MVPLSNSNFRVSFDGFHLIEIYLPLVKDQGVVYFALVVGSKDPIFFSPEFIFFSQNYVSNSSNSISSSNHNVLIIHHCLSFQLFEVALTKSDSKVEFP